MGGLGGDRMLGLIQHGMDELSQKLLDFRLALVTI